MPKSVRPLLLGCFILSVACGNMPSPQSPAEPIGEYPVWGQNFQKQNQRPSAGDSLLGATPGKAGSLPTDAPNEAEKTGSGGASAPNAKNTFSQGNWKAGNPELGRQVFVNQCAQCHGMDGKGGNRPGIGMVPTLTDPAWHARKSDDQLASTIAHGKGRMPPFMQKLAKAELEGVVAYIRTLAAPAK